MTNAAGYLALIEDNAHGVSHCGDRYAGLYIEVVSNQVSAPTRGRRATYRHSYWVNGKRVYRRAEVVERMEAALAA